MSFRSRSSDRVAVRFSTSGPTMAKQAFRDECNMNNILKKYRNTGALTHIAQSLPRFGDFSEALEYRQAIDAVRAADELFASMPADVRKRFNNSPSDLMDFCANPANLDEARKLGLAKPATAPAVAQAPAMSPPAPTPPVST